MNYCVNCNKKDHCCIYPKGKGYVTVYINEAKIIKKKTGLDYNEFLTFKKLPKKLVLASKKDFKGSEARLRSGMMINDKILRLKTKKGGECIFLKNKKCSIYKIRPTICRMYPYWVKNKIITVHDGCTKCSLLDKPLTHKEMNELISISKKIMKQTKEYLKKILDFVKENNVN